MSLECPRPDLQSIESSVEENFELSAETFEEDVQSKIDAQLMSNAERTLLEVLLEAAFGTQCRKDAGLPPVHTCPPPEDDPGPAGVKSLLALDDVLARGYSLRCAIQERHEHPDLLQPEPHGHSLKMFSDEPAHSSPEHSPQNTSEIVKS